MIIEKMWHLMTITLLVIVGALSMIKKGTDKYINKIPDCPSLYEIQKFHFAKLLIFGEYCQCLGRIKPKRNSKKHKYIVGI